VRRSGAVRLAYAPTVALITSLVAGCSSQPITETAFVRTATEGASLVSAAAETLRGVHAQPPSLTVEYGTGAFLNYHELVVPIPDSLPSAQGAPDPQTIDQLVGLVNESLEALAAPCLLPDCDWQSQLQTFEETKDALLAAAE
jgi:hypothetical protein